MIWAVGEYYPLDDEMPFWEHAHNDKGSLSATFPEPPEDDGKDGS